MSPHAHPTFARNDHTKGFAIVISLSLMAFVLLLLLSITTLVQTETASARISKEQLAARQNALLALQMAIGQLQKEAGPDQRATARADVLDTTREEAALWTGSWKTYDPDDADAHLGTIRSLHEASPTWLVSGNDTTTIPDPTTAAADKVTLLNYIDRNDLAKQVEVPRVATDPQNDTGGIAWWSSDESTKAKVNPASVDQSSFGNSINESQRRFMAPQKAALQTVSANDWGKVLDTPGLLEKTNTFNSLPLLAGSDARPDFVERYSTDVTTHSLGILANNRKGGLRKDLTYALGNTTQYERTLSLLPQLAAGVYNTERLLFTDSASSPLTDYDIYGDSWDTFYNYYNLYKRDYPTPSTTFGSIGNDAFLQGSQVKNLEDNQDPNPTLYPRVDRFLDSSDYVKDLCIYPPGQQVAKGTKPLRDPNEYRRRPFSPIRPALVQVKVSFSMRSIKFSEANIALQNQLRPYLSDGVDESSAYFFRVFGHPTFVICNPYNVQLKTGSAASPYNNRGAYSLYFTDQDTYYLKLGGADQPAMRIGRLLNEGMANMFGQFKLFVPDVTLEPGQVMVFGLGLNQQLEWPNDHKINIEGVSGDDIDEDSYFYTNLFKTEVVPDLDEDGNEQYDSNGVLITKTIPILATADDLTADVIFGSYNSRVRAQVDLSLPEVHSHTNVRLNGIMVDTKEDDGNVKEFNLGSLAVINTEFPSAFLGYQLRALTPEDSLPSYAHFNPIAYSSQTYAAYTGSGDRILDLDEAIPEHDGDNAFWGKGYSQADGTSRIILYDIPRQPMQSIGDFMHASFGFVAEDPLYVVGNSYPSPFIQKSKTFSIVDPFGNQPKNAAHFLDRSYYLNDRLFDEYFFSTVPNSTRETSKTFPYNTPFDQDYIDEGLPLQNTRLIYNTLDGATPTLTSLQGQDATRSVDAFSTAAANLLIDGPFNINSTSIDAWLAILSAHRDEALRISDASSIATPVNKTLDDSSLRNPFTRFTAPRGIADQTWTGFASLTDLEIVDLATAIVNEIKNRGPFYTLGDFINRDPFRASDGFATRGPLQQAIDNTSINADIQIGKENPTITKTINAGRGEFIIYNENLASSTAANIPGWLSQNDIVRQLAPIMTARGDTFKIRVYGDSKDAISGKITATAKAEAIIQRMPKFLDSTDHSDLKTSQLNTLNKTFGRKFKIIAFNWVNDA